jgi:hypothetical protein
MAITGKMMANCEGKKWKKWKKWKKTLEKLKLSFYEG